ncbi:MAG: hypothetical protein WC654_07195 [Patescibacteria group bacterium]
MNRASVVLNKLWLRLSGNRFLRVSSIALRDGTEHEVVVYSSNTFQMVGQVTPWGTILVHEFSFLSKKMGDYVIVHESAHNRQWFRYALYPLMILWIICPFLLLSAVAITIQGITAHEARYFVASITALLASAAAFAIPCLSSWFVEFLADSHAIRELGMSNILEGIEEGRALATAHGLKRPDWLSRVFGRLTHPPLPLTYRICQFLYKKELDGLRK